MYKKDIYCLLENPPPHHFSNGPSLKPGHDSYDQIEPTSWSYSPPKSGSQTRRGDAGRLELASDCAVLIGDIQRGHPGTDDASPSLRPNLRLARLRVTKTKQNKIKRLYGGPRHIIRIETIQKSKSAKRA